MSVKRTQRRCDFADDWSDPAGLAAPLQSTIDRSAAENKNEQCSGSNAEQGGGGKLQVLETLSRLANLNWLK